MVLPKYQSAKEVVAPKASPKKRGTPRGAAAEQPGKKRGKAGSAETRVASATVAAARRASIFQALQEEQSIPAHVRELLCSALPGCCSISGPFHPFQGKVIQMLSDTLRNIHIAKKSKVQKRLGITTKLRDELQRFEKTHAAAEAAAAESSADMKKKEVALAQSVASLEPCTLALENAQSVLRHGDATIGAAAMESEQIRSLRSRMGGASEESALAMLREFALDWTGESLEWRSRLDTNWIGLELSPEKLDNLTLLEGELCQRLAMLTGVISKAAVARQALVADTNSSQKRLDAANVTQRECEAALAQSRTECHERVGILEANSVSLNQQKSIVARTLKTWHTALKQLMEFEQGAHTSFKHIVKEIEKRHGAPIVKDIPVAMEEDVALLAAESELGVDWLEGKGLAECGTPVIDRQQRRAFLRRRSALLPPSCFGRLSLMARRSSVAAKRCHSEETDEVDSGAAVLSQDIGCDVKSVTATGTPVIDRQQRQAFLRRRSAVLPPSCFGRLSLMARRSSVAAKRLRMETDEIDNYCTPPDEGQAAEDINKETASLLKCQDQVGKTPHVFDGASDIPTPSRRSLGSGPH